MRTGRFGAVAFLLPPSLDSQSGWLQENLLRGIEDGLAASDRHLVVAHLPDQDRISQGVVPKMLRQWMADGFIIDYSYIIPPQMMELMERSPVPCIWLNHERPTDAVRTDDAMAGRQATEVLLQRGHRQIAFVDYSRDPVRGSMHYSNQLRYQGYQEAMATAGLQARPIFHDIQEGLVAFSRAWIEGASPPTAVVSYSDDVVHPIAQALACTGHELGRELSFISFGYNTWMGRRSVDLMQVPARAIGAAAVALLDAKVSSASPQPSRLLPMTHAAGTTIGPPPATIQR